MAIPTKPNPNPVWGSGGTKTDPGNSKRTLGWIKEVPPFEFENYILNMLNQYIAHINARGIPVWDSATTYDVGGLAMGSNNTVYKSLTNNNTGNDPTTDTTNWKKAWTDAP